MSISSGPPQHESPPGAARSARPLLQESAALLLERAFGVEFSAVDGTSGIPMFCSPSQPEGDWVLWSTLCREVMARRRPEFLQEEAPLVVLALPLWPLGSDCPVAVGVFLTRPLLPQEDLSAAARAFGMEPHVLTEWARQQSPWAPEHLQRVATLVLDQLAARQQITTLQQGRLAAPPAAWGNCADGLAAGHHASGDELDTAEADLLSSIGAIVGAQSGDAELYRQQSELLADIVRALTSAIDAKDAYTRGHSDRVARLAVLLAGELGLDQATRRTIYLAGLLHDIGKIGVSDAVLHKPGELTPSEYEHIKTHVEIGYKILVGLKRLDDVLPVVLYHHESWDGRGYPARLMGSEIPLTARIVAVADAYDAMSSDRPYGAGILDERIDATFRSGSGRQWDPQVVAAFFRICPAIRRLAEISQPSLAGSRDKS